MGAFLQGTGLDAWQMYAPFANAGIIICNFKQKYFYQRQYYIDKQAIKYTYFFQILP